MKNRSATAIKLVLACMFVIVCLGIFGFFQSYKTGVIPCDAQSKVKICSGKVSSRLAKFRSDDTSMPEYLELRKNELLGTELINVTELGMFGPGDYVPLHRYSRRQAWNADESLLDLGQGIVDAADFSVFLEKFPISTERVWSNVNPKIMMGIRYVPEPIAFTKFNVETSELEEVVRFSEFKRCSIGEGEGNSSADDRFIVFVCEHDEGERVLISYDLVKREEIGRIEADTAMNWASVSHSGNYIIVEINGTEEAGEVESLIRYSLDFKEEKLLTNDRNHGDLGVDVDGNDVFVMIGGHRIRYIELATGKIVDLGVANFLNKPGHGHVSCRNVNRPGWCYVSANGAGVVGALKIQKEVFGSGFRALLNYLSFSNASIFELWGFHNSEYKRYVSQPKAAVSPSGKQIVFSSDWRGSPLTHDFVLRLTED